MRDLGDTISLLESLFLHLPQSLPHDPPESHLQFTLDEEFIQSEGWGAEFNRRMEIAWRSWAGPITIPERGSRLTCCIQLFREAIINIPKEGDRQAWIGGWLDKLIDAAKASGALYK